MRHYCTLFDKNYLAKGLSLYSSLLHQSTKPFELTVLPLDAFTFQYLRYQKDKGTLPNINLMAESELEKFKSLQRDRTYQQWCWTLASQLLKYLFESNRIFAYDELVYLDSDLYFYNDPEIVFAELGDKSVGIVPHRFPPHDYERLRPNGLYNVSWISFKNNNHGLNTLWWWAEQCQRQCDNSTCGDQKYLDRFEDWLKDDLCKFENIGVGVAPWNISQYDVEPGPTVNDVPVVFYHFHELKRIAGDAYHYTGYPLRSTDKEYIYEPYLRCLRLMQSHIDKKLEEWK